MNNYKWNFSCGVVNGAFFTFATAFIGATTVLPAFISTLTGSKVLIGLTASIFVTGWYLPQLIVARYIENKPRKKPFYITIATIRVSSLVLLTAIIYFFTGRAPNFVLLCFFFLFSLFSLGAGVAGVPFMDIVGKIILSTKRSSFFGARRFSGGILAIGAGILVKIILKKFDYPQNYAFLFLIASVFSAISLTSFSLVKEPVYPTKKERVKFIQFIKKGFGLLRKDKNYRTLLFTRWLIGSAWMSMPFYAIYTFNILNVDKVMLGIFLSMQMAGGVISAVAWGYLGDRFGSKSVLQLTAILALMSPIIALVSPHLPIPVHYSFSLVFILVGFTLNGTMIGYSSFLLDISPVEERSAYVGFMNTLITPVLLSPLIGGVIIDIVSYDILFFITLIVVLSGLVMSTKLQKPIRYGT
jgi:MFS family permease